MLQLPPGQRDGEGPGVQARAALQHEGGMCVTHHSHLLSIDDTSHESDTGTAHAVCCRRFADYLTDVLEEGMANTWLVP